MVAVNWVLATPWVTIVAMHRATNREIAAIIAVAEAITEAQIFGKSKSAISSTKPTENVVTATSANSHTLSPVIATTTKGVPGGIAGVLLAQKR